MRWCKSQDGTIDVALLDPVSPIEWNNVILYGQAPIGPGPSPLIKELKGYLASDLGGAPSWPISPTDDGPSKE